MTIESQYSKKPLHKHKNNLAQNRNIQIKVALYAERLIGEKAIKLNHILLHSATALRVYLH